MLGSLQVSASFYGATTFHADLDGIIVSTVLNAYILLVSVMASWRCRAAGRYCHRPPGSIAATLPFVLHSQGLRDDLRQAQGKSEGAVKYLGDLQRRYRLGWFYLNGEKHYGVERVEMILDGSSMGMPLTDLHPR